MKRPMQPLACSTMTGYQPLPRLSPSGAKPRVRSSRCNSLKNVALLTRIAGCSSPNRLTRAPQLVTTLRQTSHKFCAASGSHARSRKSRLVTDDQCCCDPHHVLSCYALSSCLSSFMV